MNIQDFTKKAAANAIKNIGRTPLDKINRHVAFALNNSKSGRMPANTLSAEVLQTLANWYKELQGLSILPLEHEYWQNGLCNSCMLVTMEWTCANRLSLINLRRSFFKSWPKFSGDFMFPIPRKCGTYIDPTPEYKQLRKELSLHCIAELEKLLVPQYSFGNFPLEHRIKILKILKKLYRLPASNDSWETGLCFHTSCLDLRLTESLEALILKDNYLAEHFKTWKHFSGITHVPIPKTSGIGNKTKSRKQLRKNLCGHVIKSIEAELKYVL